MISAQPSPIARQGLPHFLSYSTHTNNTSPSPPPSVTSTSSSASDSPISSPSSSPRTLSPERHLGTILYRLCPNPPYTDNIVLGEWTSVNLKIVNEFIALPDTKALATSLHLDTSEYVLPLECSILQGLDISDDDGDGNDSSHGIDGAVSCIGMSSLLQIESRGLQSRGWHAFSSQSAGPGIYESGTGGLEFRVTFKNGGGATSGRRTGRTTAKTATTATSSRDVFWIRIGSPRQGIVPLALGPYVFPSMVPRHRTWLQQRSRPRSQPSLSIEHSIKVIRPFDIPSPYSIVGPPRTLLLTEWHNHMPQGRVWDSAFVILEIFKNRVADGIHERSKPLFAGKRILDLSAGTGLIGLYLAGLAEAELRSSKSTSPTQRTSVVVTDLHDAMDLIRHNITNNSTVAPQVDISSQVLKWGGSLSGSKEMRGLDLVIASDVIYDVLAFESLLSTLEGLCTPKRTEIYLGYKRRQLSQGKEREFFNRIRCRFNVEETTHELGVKVYRLTRG
ncbi:Methyltransferase-like protein 21B [Mortierella hygrophila]|uniref:Methyltransferase-like protein 21B n=1 Tax=Mortierella hygrophila TaxID=979708 RepID=A0A9P6EZ52_9FUNG|nr:Methyltransferase-like protein 21B [Mortierella hygrophila]